MINIIIELKEFCSLQCEAYWTFQTISKQKYVFLLDSEFSKLWRKEKIHILIGFWNKIEEMKCLKRKYLFVKKISYLFTFSYCQLLPFYCFHHKFLFEIADHQHQWATLRYENSINPEPMTYSICMTNTIFFLCSLSQYFHISVAFVLHR